MAFGIVLPRAEDIVGAGRSGKHEMLSKNLLEIILACAAGRMKLHSCDGGDGDSFDDCCTQFYKRRCETSSWRNITLSLGFVLIRRG